VVKVIQFLILGLLIIHISESNASVADSSKSSLKSSLKKFISPNITLSQFVDINSVDKDGDLEIDSYELLSKK
jgi:hypothetical protein